MVLDATLLSTQHYNMKIKGKVDQSWEWSIVLLYTMVLELLKKEPSGHPRLRSFCTHFVKFAETKNMLLIQFNSSCIYSFWRIVLLAGAVENTNCFSAEE